METQFPIWLCRTASYLRCEAATIAKVEGRDKTPIKPSAMASGFPRLHMAEVKQVRRSHPNEVRVQYKHPKSHKGILLPFPISTLSMAR